MDDRVVVKQNGDIGCTMRDMKGDITVPDYANAVEEGRRDYPDVRKSFVEDGTAVISGVRVQR